MTTTNQFESKQLCFFDYVKESEECVLRVYGTNEVPLFMAKDVCDILGYKNSRDTLKKHVDEEDRFKYQNDKCSDSIHFTSHPHSTLINESGLYCLILRSKKKEAVKFRKWVTQEVLPSIRKTGSYTHSSYPHQQTRDERLDTIKVLQEYHKLMIMLGGLDERDSILLKDLAKNTVTENKYGLLENKVENQEWSVSRRLTEQFGVRFTDKVKRRSISFGKLLAKKYREINEGDSPVKRSQFVQGTTRSVNCYYLSDWEQFGDELLKEQFGDVLPSDESDTE